MFVYESTSSMAVQLTNGIRITAYSLQRYRRMSIPHKDMKVGVRPLQIRELKKVAVMKRERGAWNCMPLLVFYCCDISENNIMSSVRHSDAVKTKCKL